jgi:hypothetical protein
MHMHTDTHTCHMGGCRIATHTRVPWPPLCSAAKKMQEATRTLGTESERESVSEVTFPSAELASATIDSKYNVNHITIHGNLSSPLSSLDALCVVSECCVRRVSPGPRTIRSLPCVHATPSFYPHSETHTHFVAFKILRPCTHLHCKCFVCVCTVWLGVKVHLVHVSQLPAALTLKMCCALCVLLGVRVKGCAL